MRPRLEWLETFLAIVETGGLTSAAERIARSQSAVSLQLRQLEEVIGARLFHREGRRVSLTAVGERLVPLAQRTVDAADAASTVAGGRESRLVRAGILEEYVDCLLPGLLADLAKRDPLLTVEVQCESSRILEHRLRGGQLDLAFVLSDEIEGRGAPVVKDEVVWLQAPGSALLERRPLPVALFDQACSWRNRAIDSLVGIDFEVVVTSASVAGIRAGIRSGTAVGVLAASTVGPGLERIRGSGAPPALPQAELVLLSGLAGKRDEELFVSGARRQFPRSVIHTG